MKFYKLFLLLILAQSLQAVMVASDLSDCISNIHSKLNDVVLQDGGAKCQEIIDNGIVEFRQLILENKDQINKPSDWQKQGATPLMLAAYYHLYEIIEILLENGAQLELTDKYGNTALDYMIIRGWKIPRGSCAYITKAIMQNYYTKERHNKCLLLLTNNSFKRWWYSTNKDGLINSWQYELGFCGNPF